LTILLLRAVVVVAVRVAAEQVDFVPLLLLQVVAVA
jgi:hypothetical protein